MGTITGARATQMDMPRHLPTYSWVIDCLHLIAWTLHTPHTIGCWRLSSNIPLAIIITYDLIYPQYMQFWFILGSFFIQKNLTLCLYGLVLVRVWFLLLMVLMLLSMLLLWEPGPGLGGPPCSRLSVSDLGSDSSHERRTYKYQIVRQTQCKQTDQYYFYDYRLFRKYSPWSCHQGTLWRPWSVCCWSLPRASGCCWRHPANEGGSHIVFLFISKDFVVDSVLSTP